MILISVDVHEPKKVFQTLQKITNNQSEQVALEVSDYIVWGKPTWYLERKSASDFISSWMNGSLITQLNNLSNLMSLQGSSNRTTRCGLILDGNLGKEIKRRNKKLKNKINLSSILHFKCSIPISWGIPVFELPYAWNIPYFLNYTSSKVVKTGEKKEYPVRASVSRKLSLDEQAEGILQGFRGVGVQTSRGLLREYGSIRGIIIMNEEFLNKVIKNKTTTKNMLKIIRHEYGKVE